MQQGGELVHDAQGIRVLLAQELAPPPPGLPVELLGLPQGALHVQAGREVAHRRQRLGVPVAKARAPRREHVSVQGLGAVDVRGLEHAREAAREPQSLHVRRPQAGPAGLEEVVVQGPRLLRESPRLQQRAQLSCHGQGLGVPNAEEIDGARADLAICSDRVLLLPHRVEEHGQGAHHGERGQVRIAEELPAARQALAQQGLRLAESPAIAQDHGQADHAIKGVNMDSPEGLSEALQCLLEERLRLFCPRWRIHRGRQVVDAEQSL
mmetsp:Transcript_22601/g.64138  ORF Transcript_22601/g.64138 Transcript_22601/m.64138 type:complete len:266 (+) Transcript_22601:405-1202(+)